MRERLALWLHKTAFHLLNASDYLLETPRSLADEKPFPGELVTIVDNEDERNWGESPQ